MTTKGAIVESDYQGTLSTLTMYGTLNVSAARIPRKKRSRGNVAKPRTRTIALTDCVSIMPDGTRTMFAPITTPKTRTRKPNRVIVVKDLAYNQTYARRLEIEGATGNID